MEPINVLVVTDAQVDFSSGSLGTAEAMASIPHIVEKIHQEGDKGSIIFATKDTHDDEYLNTHEGKNLPVVHTVAGTPGWDIASPIRDALDKYGYMNVLKDRFGSLDLPSVVRTFASQAAGQYVTDGKGLRITVIGWCTDICVLSNAIILRAAFPEAEILVDAKCCAGVTPETHNAALTVMRSCQITVV